MVQKTKCIYGGSMIMRKRMIVQILCILLTLGTCALTVRADSLGFATQEPTEKEKQQIIRSVGLEVVDTMRNPGGLHDFDVNGDGTYTLAFGSGSNCITQVYDPNGTFLYGFKFHSDGDYSIGFLGDALAIYLVRSDFILVYDADGVCIDVQKVISSTQNLLNAKELLTRTSKIVDGRQYVLERDSDIGGTYSRFVMVHGNGEKTVLYDCSVSHTVGQGTTVACVTSFFLFVIWGIVNKVKRTDK